MKIKQIILSMALCCQAATWAATPAETIDAAVARDPELTRTAPALATRHALKRLICLDLDATLCQHRTAPPPENLAMLDKLRAKYKCIMVGAGNAPRIYKQMGGYPIDIVANYGMQESRMVDGKFTIVKQLSNQVDRAFFKEKTDYLRRKYGYTEFDGNSVEFHPSGMVTFGLLGSTAAAEQKVHFDPDRAKRRKMYPEVCEIFKDYSVYIGGSSSFDFAGKKHNKYDAVMDYAARHGYRRDEILFIGDDFDDGGGDSHVRIFGMDYIHIHDFRNFPRRTAFLLDLPVASSLVSPDGRVSCAFSLEDGRPVADVSYGGKHVFRTALGIDRGKVRMAESEARTVRGSWKPVWGFKGEYPENYSELAVKLVREGREGKEPPAETLYLRCYDEGFAVRAKFVMEPYGVTSIAGELTNWRFAEGAAAWGIRGTEATFPEDPIPLGKMDGSGWRMPFTLRVPGVAYASVFEAHAEHYPRSYLNVEKGVVSPRFAMGVKEGRGVTLTPWRAVALAASPAELAERAYFVENLNPPCAIKDTSWIKPGFCVSDQGNFKLRTGDIVAAAKSAAATGAKYIQIDWGWYGTECPWTDDDRAAYLSRHPELKDDKTWVENTRANPFTAAVGTVPYHPYWPFNIDRTGVEMDMPKIVSELRAHGLGLCLYVHGAVLEANDMDALFATYSKWGVAGLKPGFVGYGSQATTDFIRRMCATAAKHHLWLDIHDLHVPDGIERTWPNLMITEGGGGEEGNHPVRQDVALPFTRCLAGPFDYTPMLFNAGKAGATKLHKLAMFVVYPGATSVMRGSITDLVEKSPEAVEFLRALPWNYDDTRVLDAEVARHLTVVRRKGDSFYVGGLTGAAAHETTIALDFLEDGRAYDMTLLSDDQSSSAMPRGYVREVRQVKKGDSLKVEMCASGGFCAVIRASAPVGFRIMSYNVHHCEGMDKVLDVPRVAAVVNRSRPRFAALQEIDCRTRRSKGIDEAAELGRLTGMVPTFAKTINFQGGEYGVMILSREKPISVEKVPLPGKEPRVLLLAEFSDCFVGSTHLSVSAEKERADSVALIEKAVKGRAKPVFVAGDWNSLPNTSVLKGLGGFLKVLSPTYCRTYHGSPANGPSGTADDFCIDYIAVDSSSAAKFKVVEGSLIADRVTSDHAPIQIMVEPIP